MSKDVSLPGFTVRTTPRGITVVEIDYWADPAKRDPAWAEAERKRQPSYKAFRQEYLRDWTSPAGDAYFPEFVLNGGRNTYVAEIPGLLNGPVLRAWDFGVRYPACLWMQKSRSGRLHLLREWMPDNIDVRTFRDVVLYLSGQLEVSQLSRTAWAWVSRINDDPKLPKAPWFPPTGSSRRWIDVSGHEANYTSDMPEAESQERTRASILAEAGVNLSVHHTSVEAREDIIRDLLKLREDGWPGLIIDPYCTITIDGLTGGISYPKPTPANPIPTKPARDGYYEHLHDALGYGSIYFFPVAGAPPAPVEAPVRRGRRLISASMPEQTFLDRSIYDSLAQRHW